LRSKPSCHGWLLLDGGKPWQAQENSGPGARFFFLPGACAGVDAMLRPMACGVPQRIAAATIFCSATLARATISA